MRLMLMGDLHYHDVDPAVPGWAEARDAFYEKLLGYFLETDADLHISLGDLTNSGSESELRDVYALLRRKERTFVHVLGNHDLYVQPRADVLRLTGGRRYHAIETDEAVLLFLDTAREMEPENLGGWIDEEQLQWFEEKVRTSASRPLLVFAHHPVHRTTARSEADKGSIHPDIEMWRILRQKQGSGVYFNGHTHVDSIVRQQGWTFVQLSACLDQPGFRIVDIGDREIRIRAVDCPDADLFGRAQVLHRHMPRFRHNPDARGQEADREATVPLMAAGLPR
ncbi:hypothetical protein PACILC2_18850 [Paenibacillus cisolokensis]|uniref:Calcineurin-like phosphoesterase domain-containing protein n=1 Tax=Paenibacillus cisolokensis TaxID=1658519 RepID=A0ABQ4N585_9BACL|nr:metallophosphoesterase [Paenibacillus cisolokensis]GIQ63317.1 hypothetical protein PACILC2_18850 [Paenibacillus cisolokensis]